MFIAIYTFIQRGEVNGVFDMIPMVDCKTTEENDKAVLEAFRRDREKNTIGYCVPESNPSFDPSVVTYLYRPCMEKQRLYRQLPINSGNYDIIDAFVCLGSRFGLKTLQVFVEVCKSKYGCGAEYWANIYYVADSQIPACIVEVDRWVLKFDSKLLKSKIAKEETLDAHLQQRYEQMEKEIAESEKVSIK